MLTPSTPSSSTRSAATVTMFSKLRRGRPRPRSPGGTGRALHQAALPGAGAASWGQRAGSAIGSIVSPGLGHELDARSIYGYIVSVISRTILKGRTRMHLTALLIALIAGLAIIVLGARFILQPRQATLDFGIAADDLRGLTEIKGARDIASGVVLLVARASAGP